MVSQKVVIPAQAGIQGIYKALKRLDSHFHGMTEKWLFGLFTRPSIFVK
jgi:hypothetical protein